MHPYISLNRCPGSFSGIKMSLSDDDIDRIGDKMKLAVGDAMASHLEKEHVTIWRKIARMDNKMAYWGGGLTVALGVLEYIHKMQP